jgi:hypothetical protein
VTELALDDWVAQQYGLTLDKIPVVKPPNMPQEAYELLKKYQQINIQKRPISPRSRKLLFPGF